MSNSNSWEANSTPHDALAAYPLSCSVSWCLAVLRVKKNDISAALWLGNDLHFTLYYKYT